MRGLATERRHQAAQRRHALPVTVGVGWIRKSGRYDQLFLATDSRLGGDGNLWDQCPKLVSLPRRDAVVAFSGTTAQAYPLMLQVSNSILGYESGRDGNQELHYLLEHLERVANAVLSSIGADPAVVGPRPEGNFVSPGDVVVLGGFSRQIGLTLRALRYQSATRDWRFTKVRSTPRGGPNKPIVVFGAIGSRWLNIAACFVMR